MIIQTVVTSQRTAICETDAEYDALVLWLETAGDAKLAARGAAAWTADRPTRTVVMIGPPEASTINTGQPIT